MNLVFSKDILVIKDIQNLTKLLENFIRKQTFEDYRKRGIIIGISGGIDSAVAAALACNAVGNENVLGIILPEKESNRESQELAKTLCNKLKIKYVVEDITQILESGSVYQIREKIVQKLFPEYNNSFTVEKKFTIFFQRQTCKMTQNMRNNKITKKYFYVGLRKWTHIWDSLGVI